MRSEMFIGAPSIFEIAQEAYVDTLSAESDTAPNQRSALISVVFSVVALEGVVNESAGHAEMTLQTTSAVNKLEWLYNFTHLLKEAEEMRAPLQAKFALASFAISGKFPDKGSQPYQDFTLLIKVRNELAHFKPLDKINSPTNGVRAPKIISQLESRKLLASIPQASWADRLKTRAVASWACDTASAMVYSLLDEIPEDDADVNFKHKMETFYRYGFRPTSQINGQPEG